MFPSFSILYIFILYSSVFIYSEKNKHKNSSCETVGTPQAIRPAVPLRRSPSKDTTGELRGCYVLGGFPWDPGWLSTRIFRWIRFLVEKKISVLKFELVSFLVDFVGGLSVS